MRWWEIAFLVLVLGGPVVLGACFGWLAGAQAAERRLDRIQERELARPRINDQLAADRAEAGGS